jgi:predicted membrane protein
METQAIARQARFATGAEWFEEDEFEELSEPFVTDEDSFEHGAAFDGLKIRVLSRQFRSGRVTAVLSGVTLDLRDATLSPEGATISVQSALSGIDILVPEDWEVSCDVEAVCGGIDGDRAPSSSATPRPRLRVTGTVVAGGLCVR